ncbi:hypothetical protein ALC57_14792 [Trachymyrmex cornetzi]|uniref:Uncharacterized protein n=1 Tax=Trachymyrmex cornetzi TaxID=471704 RepID=A0A151IXQ6_9HYME|nr:hypothetical protein ALC57_14792 [Trachymyrmex cornetzi]
MERELEVWTKMVSEENRKRDEAKERRHKELLARQHKARETYEQFMTKLFDKLCLYKLILYIYHGAII